MKWALISFFEYIVVLFLFLFFRSFWEKALGGGVGPTPWLWQGYAPEMRDKGLKTVVSPGDKSIDLAKAFDPRQFSY